MLNFPPSEQVHYPETDQRMLLSKPVGVIATSIVFVLVVACGGGGQSGTASVESQSTPENVLIRLVEPLDDPGHYCIDVAGFGASVRLQSPLQAHTCKPNDNRDMQFMFKPLTEQLYAEEYNLCMQPETPTAGSDIYLTECLSTPLQKFENRADGTIRLAEGGAESFCIGVVEGEGRVINPIHKRRGLVVHTCEGTESSLITWSFSSLTPAQES